MATGEEPKAPSEQVTTAPAPPPASDGMQAALPQPAPPRPAPPDPAAFQRRLAWLDAALVAGVLAFAFLTACFPIANPDFFLSLAIGRLIAQGGFHFGVDPFTFGSEGVYWVHHSWLYDLLMYWIYQIPQSGVILVVLKALAVLATAEVMLRTGRIAGRSLWMPAACTALAVLALSPRLNMGAPLLSYLFLAVTLWLLTGHPRADAQRVWLIPALCLVWVNVDAWFVLGPLAVALFLLGELLQGTLTPQPGGEGREGGRSPGTLALVLAVTVLACLVNPHHVRAFTVPPALGYFEAAGPLGRDDLFRFQFLTPWEDGYFHRSMATGLNAAGLAYFPLLALGLLSFVLTFGAWRWWRVLLWVGFASLSALNTRAIPFFAVVAGPVTALNFLDAAVRVDAAAWVLSGPRRRWSVGGRLLTLLALLVAAAASVVGLPQAQPGLHQVGFGVRPDESLARAALQIKDWEDEGLTTPDDRWFNVGPEVAAYLAWYCPGQKGFLDTRLQLYGKSAADYVEVRKGLFSADGGAGADSPPWKDVFTRRKIGFLVLHSREVSRLGTVLVKLDANPEDWARLYGAGNTAIFGWRGQQSGAWRPGRLATMAENPVRRAFGPAPQPAPRGGARPAEAVPWWDQLYKPSPPPSEDLGTAVQQVLRFDGLAQLYDVAAGALNATQFIGTLGLPGGALCNGTLVNVRFVGRTATSFDGGRGQMAAAYLAVRAGRRAVAADPDNPENHLWLAEAYFRLAVFSREAAAAARLPHVELIRQSQIAYALNQVVRLDPDGHQARRANMILGQLYSRPAYMGQLRIVLFQTQLRHSKEFVRLCKDEQLISAVKTDNYQAWLEAQEQQVAALETDLGKRLDQYEISAANKPLLYKVETALRLGLSDTALELILDAKKEELGDRQNARFSPGAQLGYILLLATGRLDEVRELLGMDANGKSVDKAQLGFFPDVPAYDWFRVQVAAGSGDYRQADRALGDLLKSLRHKPRAIIPLVQFDILSPAQAAGRSPDVGTMAAMTVGHFLLEKAPQAVGLPWQLKNLPWAVNTSRPGAAKKAYVLRKRAGALTMRDIVAGLIQPILDEEVKVRTLRGWLTLEAGDVRAAEAELDKAKGLLEQGRTRRGTPAYRAAQAQPLLASCLDLIEQGKAGR
jgi:hypothetical protein